jgi:metallophosphoesterase (TIGR00282 family)
MQNKLIRIVFIGDVVGKYGRRFLGKVLPLIRIKYSPHLVIANGENSAGGLGITQKTAFEIFDSGVDVITGGNHIWDKKEALQLLKNEERILRPINYPPGAPGRGSYLFQIPGGPGVMIVNLQGRVFMEPVVNNPFLAIDDFLAQTQPLPKIIFIDFHAEATAEKVAMGFYLDGRISALLGTHTHIQTADPRVLPQGTGYQTDAGMTGSFNSIIGMKMESVLRRFTTGINQKFEVARENVILDMTVLDIDKNSGKTAKIEICRIFESNYEKFL